MSAADPVSAADIPALIRERLAALEPKVVEIYDESGEHVGHAGAQSGGGHYKLTIVSRQFQGKSRIARHRMVYRRPRRPDAVADPCPGNHGLDRRGVPERLPALNRMIRIQSNLPQFSLPQGTKMQFIKPASAAGVALAGMLTLAACNAEDNVAVVNGVPIPQARMDYVVKSQVQQGQQDNEQLRKQVKEVLITRELLVQAAIQKGLDKSPEVLTGVDMARQEFLIRAYFDDFIKNNSVTDEELKTEYERVKAQQSGAGERKEYHARHILMKDEKAAKAVLAQINKAKGKNFAALAKAKSEDSGSKAEGGLLEWSDGSNFVPEFGEAMTKLGKGEWTTTLVKTKYGYHIIMVDDIREMQFPPFDQVKDKIQQQIMAEKRDKAIEALKASAKIE